MCLGLFFICGIFSQGVITFTKENNRKYCDWLKKSSKNLSYFISIIIASPKISSFESHLFFS